MKIVLASLTALALGAAAAAPSFAASVSDPSNCYFKDASLCVTESLSPTTGNTEPAKKITHVV
jgi:hypothetical protein